MIKNIKKYLTAALLGLILSTPALATPQAPTPGLTITQDYGGNIVEYIAKFNALKELDGRLRLDGFCISACTLFLGIMPPANTCATPGSFFGFHSASTGLGTYADEGTRLLWNIYPKKVQDYLIENGWDGMSHTAHPDLIYVPAGKLMQECVSGS
jgi:hypothetical protein